MSVTRLPSRLASCTTLAGLLCLLPATSVGQPASMVAAPSGGISFDLQSRVTIGQMLARGELMVIDVHTFGRSPISIVCTDSHSRAALDYLCTLPSRPAVINVGSKDSDKVPPPRFIDKSWLVNEDRNGSDIISGTMCDGNVARQLAARVSVKHGDRYPFWTGVAEAAGLNDDGNVFTNGQPFYIGFSKNGSPHVTSLDREQGKKLYAILTDNGAAIGTLGLSWMKGLSKSDVKAAFNPPEPRNIAVVLILSPLIIIAVVCQIYRLLGVLARRRGNGRQLPSKTADDDTARE